MEQKCELLFKHLVLRIVQRLVLVQSEVSIYLVVQIALRHLKFVLATTPHAFVVVRYLLQNGAVCAHARHKLAHLLHIIRALFELVLRIAQLLLLLSVLELQGTELGLELIAPLLLSFEGIGQVCDLGPHLPQRLIELV